MDAFRNELIEEYQFCVVPSLIEKDPTKKLTTDGSFLKERARHMNMFLNKVLGHGLLKRSKSLKKFLDPTIEDKQGNYFQSIFEGSKKALIDLSLSVGGKFMTETTNPYPDKIQILQNMLKDVKVLEKTAISSYKLYEKLGDCLESE